MITARQVFDMACVLIDEVSESGIILQENPEYFKTKTKNILTQLQTELLPSSVNPVVITDLNDNLLVSDREALLILPYGLATHLLLTDDPNTASFFNDRYEELKKKRPAQRVAITDVYGVLGGLT